MEVDALKKIKLLLLLLLSFAFMLILTGCRCNPSEHQWYIEYFEINTVYANGVEQVEAYDGNPDINDPFGGMENGVVDIQFSEDGKVTFKPGTGEVLTGTFTLKHNGFKNTDFTVTLDNGEMFSGNSGTYYYSTNLAFTFRDMQYSFKKSYRNAEEIYQEDMSYMPDHIRRHVNSGSLKRATVSYTDGVYSLSEKNGDTVILDDNTTVKCVRLDEDDKMTALNSIEEGKCFSRIESNTSGKTNILIYYIEPYPEEPDDPTPPEEIKESPFLEIIPELSYYISNQEDTLIKLSKIHSPASNYKFDEILYVNDSDMIIFLFNSLFREDCILVESEQPPHNLDDFHVRWEIEISDKTGKCNKILAHFECDMFYYNGKWYSCSESPSWSSALAVACFNCNDSILTAKDNQEVTYDVRGLEFIKDREQDFNYSDVLNPIILTGEIGEIIVYDATHFYFDSKYYIVAGEKDFSELF